MYVSGTIPLLFVISQSCSTSRNKKTKQVQLAVMLVFNLLGDPFYNTICYLQYGRSKNHSTIAPVKYNFSQLNTFLRIIIIKKESDMLQDTILLPTLYQMFYNTSSSSIQHLAVCNTHKIIHHHLFILCYYADVLKENKVFLIHF